MRLKAYRPGDQQHGGDHARRSPAPAPSANGGAEQARAHRFQRRRQRIEQVNPAQPRGHRRHRIRHRARVEQDVQHHRQDVLHVAVGNHQRGGPQPEAQSPCAVRISQPRGKQHERRRGHDVVHHQQHHHHARRHREVHARTSPTPESGSTSRGKNTFEINCELPTRQPLTLLSTLLKKFQPSNPANENTQYGTPPLGSRATAPNTKEKTPAASSGCKIDPDHAERRLLVAHLEVAAREGQEQVAEAPHFPQVERGPATARSQGDVRAARRGDGRGRRWREGGGVGSELRFDHRGEKVGASERRVRPGKKRVVQGARHFNR